MSEHKIECTLFLQHICIDVWKEKRERVLIYCYHFHFCLEGNPSGSESISWKWFKEKSRREEGEEKIESKNYGSAYFVGKMKEVRWIWNDEDDDLKKKKEKDKERIASCSDFYLSTSLSNFDYLFILMITMG